MNTMYRSRQAAARIVAVGATLLPLLLAAPGVLAQQAPAADAAAAAEAVLRQLADDTAAQLVRNEQDAVYGALAPSVKAAYTRAQLIDPIAGMQRQFGRIGQYRFTHVTQGKRGVGGKWIPIVMYWYAAQTDKHANGTYLKVDVTKEQGRYYVSGYAMERVLLKGKIPSANP